MAIEEYTLEQAEEEIANLRGQVNALLEVHSIDTATDLPVTPATGISNFANTGHLNYVSSADANSYDTGRLTVAATGALTVSTALQTVPGLSGPLGVGTYAVRGQMYCTVPVTAGQGQISYQLTASGGLTASAGRATWTETHAANGVGTSDAQTLGTLQPGVTPGTGGANHVVKFDGIFVISVAGTINVQIKQAASALITVLQYPSYLEIYPVT